MGQTQAAPPSYAAPAAAAPPAAAKKSSLPLTALIVGFVALAVVVALVAAKVFGLGPFKEAESTPPAPVVQQKSAQAPVPQAAADSGNNSSQSNGKKNANQSKPTKKSVAGGARIAVWTENFESGLDDWSVVPGAHALTKGTARALSGTTSAKVSTTQDKMYRDIGWELEGPAKLTFWMYDETQGRAFGELRAYTRTGNSGTLRQSFAIGRYDVGFGPTGKGSLANEVADKTKYQGRVVFGANTGWFNLNAPGAPSRSEGWHKFEIERAADGTTINFFVDGILGRSISGATSVPLNSVEIGSLGAGSTDGIAWFDDVKLEYYGSPTSGADSTTRWTPPPDKPNKKSGNKDSTTTAKKQ